MSRIRAKNTGIEKTVFSFLRKRGIYFQKHYELAAGKPDIAIPSKKIAVFINGDFWHGYCFSGWKKRIPKKYWAQKIQSNIDRDSKNYRALRRIGWRVLRIWGHELIENPENACRKVANFIIRKPRKL